MSLKAIGITVIIFLFIGISVVSTYLLYILSIGISIVITYLIIKTIIEISSIDVSNNGSDK